ncbi:hypothetical protein DBV15_00260 [Temnothorax longispinosus]|uniref:Uncharacterized protein n=1 Tax=Temnothorax longispinosus TaxID=300112 RepID=A0A4S2KVT3_9HYME|nr:hypothetical protein DBV15_00260 [Temnothorax longispinosus]
MVGVAPTARPVTIIPLVADTSRSESPLLSHLTRAKRTAYPLNESSPDPRAHTARRGKKTPKTSLEGKMKTDERRERGERAYPCQGTRIIGCRYCPARNDVYTHPNAKLSERTVSSPETKPFVSDFMRRRQGEGGERWREKMRRKSRTAGIKLRNWATIRK